MNRFSTPVSYPWRLVCVLGILTLFVVILVIRVISLSVIDRSFLQQQGDARTLRTVEIPAYRGMITDRFGYPLAISTPVYAVWINPRQFAPNPQEIETLASLLTSTPQEIKQAQKLNREFVYLKRHVPPDLADQIKEMNLKGLSLSREYRRFYPEGETTAQIVGFTNIDDHGLEGMELAHDDWLSGAAGQKRVIKNLLGDTIAEVAQIKAPKAGRQLALSIDRRLQYFAYQTLKEAINQYQARAGSVIILDPKTGEVLALVNQPSYNPNRRGLRDDLSYRNQGIVDLFEPASTAKPFSVLNALESGQFKPNDLIDTKPGTMQVSGKLVRDLHNEGVLSLSGILERSSNIGVTKLTLAIPKKDSLYQLLDRLGLGHVTGSHFPGESMGMLKARPIWSPFTLATLSFGYGLAVTPIQLARAYATIANHGDRLPVSLVKLKAPPQSEHVINTQSADEITEMLENVVSKGTGRSAQIPGYRVAGKTGTARVVGEQGYDKSAHHALFVGFAPVSAPRLVIVVIIKEPRNGKYYGGEIAAPVFAKIMDGSLRILNIAPDKYESNVETSDETT